MQKQRIGLFHSHQSGNEPPAYFIEIEAARALKKDGKGSFIHHGTAFILKPEAVIDESMLADGRPDIRDASCRMGPSVILANANGEKWALFLTAAWA